jgi:hypothetical protein
MMTIEVLVDRNGTILALSMVHDGQESARHRARQRSEKSVTMRLPTIVIQPRAGQQRLIVELPAELQGMPLKEIHLPQNAIRSARR